jgi:biotin carboxylase
VDPGISPTEVAALAEQVTYPAVLKPAQGSGSRDIHSVQSPDQLRSLLADGATRHGALIEEYLHDAPGHPDWYASYLSVESVVSGGRTSHVALCGRFPLAEPFRETGNFIPAILPPSLQPEVLGLVDRTVDALGIRDAVIHTEVKLTPDGPRVIEVNGRLGGRPPFVLRTNSDVNLFQLACLVAAGVPVSFDGLADCKGVGYWLMLQPPMSASRVIAVDGLDGLTSLEEVDQVSTNGTAGERVSWRDGTESQVVTVRGRVADHAALAGTVEAIRSRVTITYDS